MQPVGGEHGEIRQDADADLFAHGLFDGGEVVAGEGNVGIFADLFGKPAGKAGVYGNLHETPVFAADGFQVAFMAIDAVGKMGDAMRRTARSFWVGRTRRRAMSAWRPCKSASAASL